MSNVYIGMGWMMEIIIWVFIFFFVIGFFSSVKMKNGNDKVKPFKSNRNAQQKNDNNVSQFSSVDSILGTTVGGLETFNSAIGELNDYVRLNSEVQKAVSSLEKACSFEKMAITTCLEMAKNELSIEDRFANDEQGRKQFEANVVRMKEAVSSPKQAYESHLCIDMLYTREPHSEQKIEDAIQHKYKNMVECYTEFLNKTTLGLKEKPRLRVLFERQMKKYEPDLLMRIHCFEAGGEWRYVRSFRVQGTGTPRFKFNVGEILAKVSASATKIEGHDKYVASETITFLPPERINENQSLWRKTVETLSPLARKNEAQKNKINQDIERIVTELEIPFLLHFTQASNLSSILKYGLYSVEKCKEAGIVPDINDNLRLDCRLNGTSVSIAYPNAKMFSKYRIENPNVDWVIIAIDPSILWEKDCAFCKKNAATKFIRDVPVNQLKTAQAFQSMFDDNNNFGYSSREKQGLYSCDPTDVQAEILVLDIIEPQCINAIIFESGDIYDDYAIDIIISGVHKTFISGDGIANFYTSRAAVRKS